MDYCRINYAIEDSAEQNHWWFRARRKIIENTIIGFTDETILDLGCGTGANIGLLGKHGTVFGVDNSEEALKYCGKKTDARLVRADVNRLCFKDSTFSMVFCMDLLEHTDDRAAIREIYRILKKGGTIILACPAFRFLWGGQDEVTGHRRRYNKKMIKELLKDFNIKRITYFNMLLFLPILIMRKAFRLLGRREVYENRLNNPAINWLFYHIFALETIFLKYINLPFGISLLCSAVKSAK